jgi:hypothetical protein
MYSCVILKTPREMQPDHRSEKQTAYADGGTHGDNAQSPDY